jgi:hypothetical protein
LLLSVYAGVSSLPAFQDAFSRPRLALMAFVQKELALSQSHGISHPGSGSLGADDAAACVPHEPLGALSWTFSSSVPGSVFSLMNV